MDPGVTSFNMHWTAPYALKDLDMFTNHWKCKGKNYAFSTLHHLNSMPMCCWAATITVNAQGWMPPPESLTECVSNENCDFKGTLTCHKGEWRVSRAEKELSEQEAFSNFLFLCSILCFPFLHECIIFNVAFLAVGIQATEKSSACFSSKMFQCKSYPRSQWV